MTDLIADIWTVIFRILQRNPGLVALTDANKLIEDASCALFQSSCHACIVVINSLQCILSQVVENVSISYVVFSNAR